MKTMTLCLLLLPACAYFDARYDYSLAWVCRSPEGCERTAEVALINRLSTYEDDALAFESTRHEPFFESAQRVASDSLPDGCYFLHGLSLFGHELEPEPSKLCQTSGGFDLELSIPNRNRATQSAWLVEAREL